MYFLGHPEAFVHTRGHLLFLGHPKVQSGAQLYNTFHTIDDRLKSLLFLNVLAYSY